MRVWLPCDRVICECCADLAAQEEVMTRCPSSSQAEQTSNKPGWSGDVSNTVPCNRKGFSNETTHRGIDAQTRLTINYNVLLSYGIMLDTKQEACEQRRGLSLWLAVRRQRPQGNRNCELCMQIIIKFRKFPPYFWALMQHCDLIPASRGTMMHQDHSCRRAQWHNFFVSGPRLKNHLDASLDAWKCK